MTNFEKKLAKLWATAHAYSEAIEYFNLNEQVDELFESRGYTEEHVLGSLDYVKNNIVHETDKDEFDTEMKSHLVNTYVDTLEQITKYVDMAKGYEEMGELNLSISEEWFGAESELQVGTEKAEEAV